MQPIDSWYGGWLDLDVPYHFILISGKRLLNWLFFSFYTWGHRGRVLSPHYEPPSPRSGILDIPDRFMS